MEPNPRGDPLNRWGENLVAVRGDATAAAVAREVGISAKHMSEVEQGKARPSYDLQRRFAEFYRKSITELFPRDEDELALASLAARYGEAHPDHGQAQ